jgi:hypothetical protein
LSDQLSVDLRSVLLACGEYPEESDAVSDFDKRVSIGGAFSKVYSEVEGFVEYHGIGEKQTGARIDRILFPSEKLLKSGWIHGPIGVEIKKSNTKIGPVISQALDYSRCLFCIKPTNTFIRLQWIFVFPFGNQYGDIDSIMAQNRIGWCVPSSGIDVLRFGTGSTSCIRISSGGDVFSRELKTGLKIGSR